MSRSSSTIQDGSLELLLDTICNTFGGIVFISMLVVVLLNMSGDRAATQAPTPQDELALQSSLTELEAAQLRLDTLNKTRELRSEVSDKLVTEEQLQLARQFQELELRCTARVEETARITTEAARVRQDSNSIEEQVRERTTRADALRKELAAQTASLQKEVESRSQNVTPPKLEHLPNHRSVSLILKGKRLTPVIKVGAGGVETRNIDELIVSTEDGAQYLDVKPGAGIKVNTDGSNASQIRTLLKLFRPDRHVLRVWVWPDSFEEFTVVQKSISELNFRSKPEPVMATTRLMSGAATGPVMGQ